MRRLPRLFYAATVLGVSILGLFLLQASTSSADHEHRTKAFAGAKANTGTASHSFDGKKNVLTLSDDFKVPDAPAPHWQLVDSDGNAYLLQRLVVKGDKFNKTIVVPRYVKDVAKVQIWCSWAEALLGEAPFAEVVKMGRPGDQKKS
jgi:hypothetical protein